jgi:hypothetical protein
MIGQISGKFSGARTSEQKKAAAFARDRFIVRTLGN